MPQNVKRGTYPRGSSHEGTGRGRPARDRRIPVARAARRGRHGPGLPRALPGRPRGGHQGRPSGPGQRRRVPAPVRPGGRRGPGRQRDLHRAGRRQRAERAPAVASHRVRARAPFGSGRGGKRAFARAGAVAAARRAGRGPAGDTCLRGGTPRPQARQRAAGRRRAAGDRLRYLPRRRRNRADGGRSGVRHAGFHVTRASRGTERRPRERRVRARVRGRLRGGRSGSVRHRHGGRHLVPRGALRAGPGRDTAAAAGDDRRVPGQGPGRPPHAAGAFRRDLQRPGRDRAVRGGVLAVLGGRPDRRLSGPARAGNARRQQAGRSRGIFLGFQVHVRVPADHAVGPREQPAAAAARTGTRRRHPLALPRALSQPEPQPQPQPQSQPHPSRSPSLSPSLRAILSLRATAAGRRRRRHMPRRVATCRRTAGLPAPDRRPAPVTRRRTGWDHEGRLPRCPPAWPPRSG